MTDVSGVWVSSAVVGFSTGNQAWPPAITGMASEKYRFLSPVPSILGRSGVGPGNMYFQSSGQSFIPVSMPGTLGGTENIIAREKNQFLPYGPFK